MPKVWSRVLTLPPRPAAMTPCRMTQKRTAVMPHSRTSTTIVTHHQTSPMTDSPTRAIVTSALSAMGSRTLPTLVTRPRLRARSPSIRSVSIATANTPNAAHR